MNRGIPDSAAIARSKLLGCRSTRSAKYPMAFTWGEFWLGAVIAWGVFQLLAAGATALLSWTFGGIAYAAIAAPTTAWISALATSLLGIPAAWLLGTTLRRVRPMWVHLLAFAVLGGIVTIATFCLLELWGVGDSTPFEWQTTWLLTAIYIGPGAVSVAGGWWWTAALALRTDRRRAARAILRAADGDAAAESPVGRT